MATFVMLGKYSPQSMAGIAAARTKKAEAIIAKAGGRLKSAYALLGPHDLLLIADFNSITAAMKASVALAKLTGIGFTTSPAMPVAEFDRVMGMR